MTPRMIRKTFSVPPLGCNCSIIGDPVTKQAIVVDPGGAPERILREVQQLGLTVTHILHTHAHLDHFLASGDMKKVTGATICLHHDDLDLWKMLEVQCELFGVAYVPVPRRKVRRSMERCLRMFMVVIWFERVQRRRRLARAIAGAARISGWFRWWRGPRSPQGGRARR